MHDVGESVADTGAMADVDTIDAVTMLLLIDTEIKMHEVAIADLDARRRRIFKEEIVGAAE